MRFFADGPDIPHELIVAQEKGEAIFVCGAGVSRAVNLPSFEELVHKVYEALGERWEHHPAEATAMAHYQYDRALRCLERRLAASNKPEARGMRKRIRDAVDMSLKAPTGADLSNHLALLTLSADAEGRECLLTTNFDTLFERAWKEAHGVDIPSHAGVALPQPHTANAYGVLHLHGRSADPDLGLSETDIVLTSAEFGDAYLRAGWASRYLYDLARAETLVLVGYQADDPPMRYLLEALEADRERFPDLRKVYAFDASTGEDEASVNASWLAKGVEPILYRKVGNSHKALYRTIKEWQRYAQDPTTWRRERFAEHLRTREGELSQVDIDAAKTLLDRGDGPQILGEVSPPAAWLPLLMKAGVITTAALPSEWIASRLDDPDMIRACAGLPQLDQHTMWRLEHQLDRRRLDISEMRAHAWRLLLFVKRKRLVPEAFEDRWYGQESAIKRGFVDFQTRDVVVRTLLPELSVEAPYRWPGYTDEDGEERLDHLLRIEFEPARGPPPSEIVAAWPNTSGDTSSLLSALDRALRNALDRANDLGLLGRWDRASRDVPSVANHAQNQYRHGFYPITRVVADLWVRLSEHETSAAQRFAIEWWESPRILLKRIALFSFSFPIFSENRVASYLHQISDEFFWQSNIQVELMRLLVDRWPHFAADDRDQFEQRIRNGVPRTIYDPEIFEDQEKWQSISDASIFRRLSRLSAAGGALSAESNDVLREIQNRHSGWSASESDRDDFSTWREVRHGLDGHPDQLAAIPDDQLVQEALRIQSERQHDQGDLWRVFSSADPERALRGLIAEADQERWDAEAWSQVIWAISENEELALQHQLTVEVLRMPDDVLSEILGAVASWLDRRSQQLKEVGEVPMQSFFEVWDRLADLAFVRNELPDPDAQSDDVVLESLNRPGGDLAGTLLEAMVKNEAPDGGEFSTDFSKRLTIIADAHNRAGLLGRVRLVRDLAYFDAIAPEWTHEKLVPRLHWTHPEASEMWEANAGGRIGSPRLFNALKPELIKAFRRTEMRDDSLAHLFDRLLQVAFSHQRGDKADYLLDPLEIKRSLAVAPSDVRRHVSWSFWRGMSEKDDDAVDKAALWRMTFGPIFAQIWPLDRNTREPETSSNLTLMALECGDAFPDAVAAILDILVPYQLYTLSHALRLERHNDALVEQHPSSFIRLIDALVDPSKFPPPPDLASVLKRCVNADPSLAQDRSFRRLSALQRRMGA